MPKFELSRVRRPTGDSINENVDENSFIRISDSEYLRIAVVPTDERGDSYNPYFNPDDFKSLFKDDGLKNFNEMM